MPLEKPEVVYMGNIGRAWARLASYYFMKRPMISLTQLVKKPTPAVAQGSENIFSDSDEERDAQLDHMRATKR